MKDIVRIFLPLVAIIIFVNFYYESPPGIQAIDNYPIWMKDSSGMQTDQTSGMAYVGADSSGKTFIACDDIGKINRIKVNEKIKPPSLEIFNIAFSKEVQTLFDKFKKVDMEDIYFDKINNRIYLSIEGHEYSSYDPEIYRKKEGIYELTFNNDIMTFDTILTIKRLTLPDEVYKHTYDNVGFEGFALTENHLYLGLENLQDTSNIFTDSTLIYILDRSSKKVLKTLSTRSEGISTICGLYAVDDYNLLGIDRNTSRMFHISFDRDFNIDNSELLEMDLSVPGHKDMDNVIGIAVESITMDDSGNLYSSTDPWKDFYKPDLAERKRLSKEELKNFFDYVPIMYKFKNEFKK
ncbi:MAG: esterase-like activity of phytase family protein [Bacteroidetes bacterium]|nr:esterase-like activity of phytase family protein [Bacteroidota bacterium]